MKTAICSLFAVVAIALTAFAAPSIHVATTITQLDANGNASLLAMPQIVVTNGKQATIQVGSLECAVTPTLLDTGNVVAQFVITDHTGGQAKQLAAPRIVTPLNQTAKLEFGTYSLTARMSLLK